LRIPDDPDRAYVEALAEGDPEAGRYARLVSFKRALFRRDLKEAEHFADDEVLKRFLADLGEGRLAPWLEEGPRFLRAEAWVKRGARLAEEGDLEGAREAFLRAKELYPRHPRALVNLGNLELEAGRPDEAIALYQEALRIDPDLADAHHNLAAAYKKKGDIDRMVRHLKRSQRLRLFPPSERTGRRGGAAPVWTRFWFWLLIAALLYGLSRGFGV